MATSESRPWFAVQVKTTHEKRVSALLDCQGYERFLPLYACSRHWSDRIKHVQMPLFPGYVFCRFNPESRISILKTPSVLRIAGVGLTPTPIDEEEIDSIQRVVKSGLGVSPHPFLKIGRLVRITCGSLAGLEGIIASVRSGDRLILSVSLLQRSVAVEIESAWVVPIQQSLAHPTQEVSGNR